MRVFLFLTAVIPAVVFRHSGASRNLIGDAEVARGIPACAGMTAKVFVKK